MIARACLFLTLAACSSPPAIDAGTDAGMLRDAGKDAGLEDDAGTDAGQDEMDAGSDAGRDGGTDAGAMDAGSDAGMLDAGDCVGDCNGVEHAREARECFNETEASDLAYLRSIAEMNGTTCPDGRPIRGFRLYRAGDCLRTDRYYCDA